MVTQWLCMLSRVSHTTEGQPPWSLPGAHPNTRPFLQE